VFWGLHTLPSGEIKGFKCAEKMTAFHLTVDCHLGISMDQLFLCWWQSQYIPSGIWSIWDEINHPSWLEARQQKKTNKTEPIWPYGTVTYLWYGHHMAIIWPSYGHHMAIWYCNLPMDTYGRLWVSRLTVLLVASRHQELVCLRHLDCKPRNSPRGSKR